MIKLFHVMIKLFHINIIHDMRYKLVFSNTSYTDIS